MSKSDNIQLQHVIENKEARIRELEEQIKVLKEKIRAHESTIKKLTQEHQSLAKETDELKKEKCKKEKEKKDLEKEKKDLEKEVKKLKTWNSAKDSRLNKMEEEVKNNKISHDEEMKRLKENTKTQLENLKANLTKKLEEKQQQCNQHLEYIKTLQEENNNLTVPNSLEQCYLCIGQLCSDLQAKMYQYVLPDEYSSGWSYKFKYIEKDIENLMKDGDPRKGQAKTRLESLKKNIKWEKKYEGVLKIIQRKRNKVAHPEILNAEAARRAVQQLKEQGQLEGRTNIESVLKLIEMWEYLST